MSCTASQKDTAQVCLTHTASRKQTGSKQNHAISSRISSICILLKLTGQTAYFSLLKVAPTEPLELSPSRDLSEARFINAELINSALIKRRRKAHKIKALRLKPYFSVAELYIHILIAFQNFRMCQNSKVFYHYVSLCIIVYHHVSLCIANIRYV